MPVAAAKVRKIEPAFWDDNGWWASVKSCGSCLVDASTCALTALLACRGPLELTPVGDAVSVLRAAADYLAGGEVDDIDLMLSLAGLTATSLVIVSGATSYSVKVGTGLAKLT